MPLCLGEGFRGEAGMPSAASLPSAGWKRAPHGARPVLERRRNSCALTRSAPPPAPRICVSCLSRGRLRVSRGVGGGGRGEGGGLLSC